MLFWYYSSHFFVFQVLYLSLKSKRESFSVFWKSKQLPSTEFLFILSVIPSKYYRSLLRYDLPWLNSCFPWTILLFPYDLNDHQFPVIITSSKPAQFKSHIIVVILDSWWTILMLFAVSVQLLMKSRKINTILLPLIPCLSGNQELKRCDMINPAS